MGSKRVPHVVDARLPEVEIPALKVRKEIVRELNLLHSKASVIDLSIHQLWFRKFGDVEDCWHSRD